MDTPVAETDTKTTLLDCAEQLFLEHGLDAVSVREITDAAGANVAAVNYHFNGKVNLYREVLSRRFAEVARRKVALIEGLETVSGSLTLRAIVTGYVRSHFEEIMTNPDGERLLQIVYREMSADAVAADLVTETLIKPIHQALSQTIRKVCPDLPEQYVSRCISSITGQVLHYIRFREVLKELTMAATDNEFIEAATQHITEFSLRGIGSKSHD